MRKEVAMHLLTLETAKNAHTKDRTKYLVGVLLLSPHKEAYRYTKRNTCPYADGCEKVCLKTAGRLKFDGAKKARIRRTKLLFKDKKAFRSQLVQDIHAVCRKAKREGKRPAIRLNGLSDLNWERIFPGLMREFPKVQFYDYTKDPARAFNKQNDNYHLTYSYGARTDDDKVTMAFATKCNVAIVYKDLPKTQLLAGKRYKVIDGDLHDARWTDRFPRVVGLRAKGKAKQDSTGFVQHR
jgi:hypothetical protein